MGMSSTFELIFKNLLHSLQLLLNTAHIQNDPKQSNKTNVRLGVCIIVTSQIENAQHTDLRVGKRKQTSAVSIGFILCWVSGSGHSHILAAVIPSPCDFRSGYDAPSIPKDVYLLLGMEM